MRLSLNKIIIAFAILLVTSTASADGGGVLLAMINPASFLIGNIAVVLIEFIYFIYKYKDESKFRLFIAALKINIVSLVFGTILFSIIITLISLEGYSLSENGHKELGNFLYSLGTGISGSQSPFSLLAIIMLPVYYLIIYLITVYIEYKLMLMDGFKVTLKQSFIWNFFSYTFLAVFAFIALSLHYFDLSLWIQNISLYILGIR